MSLLIFLSASFYTTPSKHLLPQRPYHSTTTVSLFAWSFWVSASVLHCFHDYIFHLLQLLTYAKMLLSLSFCSIPDRLYVFLVCLFILQFPDPQLIHPHPLLPTSQLSSGWHHIAREAYDNNNNYQFVFCHKFFTWYYLGISNYRFVPLSHKDIIHCAFYRSRCVWH